MHSTPTTIPCQQTSLSINYAVFILTRNGFVARTGSDANHIKFHRPNSYWAVNMLLDGERVFIEKACSSVITIGGTFVEEFLRNGLFTLEMRNGKCVIASI
jgi:hypothetical protein